MTPYYYPFGYTPNITQVGNTPLAGRADTASMSNITVLTVSFASIVINTPSAGASGSSATCTTGPTGAKGATGAAGAVAGTSLNSCPKGTMYCSSITPPAGYSRVCIQIPEGCTVGAPLRCPDTISGYAPEYNPFA